MEPQSDTDAATFTNHEIMGRFLFGHRTTFQGELFISHMTCRCLLNSPRTNPDRPLHFSRRGVPAERPTPERDQAMPPTSTRTRFESAQALLLQTDRRREFAAPRPLALALDRRSRRITPQPNSPMKRPSTATGWPRLGQDQLGPASGDHRLIGRLVHSHIKVCPR